jgi:hypothetical protein
VRDPLNRSSVEQRIRAFAFEGPHFAARVLAGPPRAH